MEEQSRSLFLGSFPFFSLQQKICGIWEKRKEKLLGLNVKPQDLKNSVYFSAKFVFLPMGAKTLSNAGLCWQLGAWKRLLYMEEVR